MGKNNPLVSVIMPAYNAEKYIEEAALSVLQQTYTNLELIIVNDCSTDNTLNLINALALHDQRIFVLNNASNLGCADSRSSALRRAKGEYIAFCDSDDVWAKDKLKKQLHYIKKRNADMVFTAYAMIAGDGSFIKRRDAKDIIDMDDLLKENSIIFSTTLFKKASLAGLQFDGSWFHEDYVFLLECLQRKLKFVGIDEILVLYRVHSQGRSQEKINAAKHRWKIYRKFLRLSLGKSLCCFFQYALNGLKKYR